MATWMTDIRNCLSLLLLTWSQTLQPQNKGRELLDMNEAALHVFGANAQGIWSLDVQSSHDMTSGVSRH